MSEAELIVWVWGWLESGFGVFGQRNEMKMKWNEMLGNEMKCWKMKWKWKEMLWNEMLEMKWNEMLENEMKWKWNEMKCWKSVCNGRIYQDLIAQPKED